jgi:hypothetical protein
MAVVEIAEFFAGRAGILIVKAVDPPLTGPGDEVSGGEAGAPVVQETIFIPTFAAAPNVMLPHWLFTTWIWLPTHVLLLQIPATVNVTAPIEPETETQVPHAFVASTSFDTKT